MFPGADPKTSITNLIEKFVLPLHGKVLQEKSSGSHHIAQLMEILKDDSIVELLGVVHKTMLPYFAFYANNKGMMNFEGYWK